MANKVFAAPGSTQLWTPAGVTPDLAFNVASLGIGAGRVSAQWNRGTGSKASLYRWQARCRANVAPVVGEVVRMYLILGDDGTFVTGDHGNADAAVATEDLFRNAEFLDVIIADVANNTSDFVAQGVVPIRSQYVQIGWWNAMSQILHATGGNHEFRLTEYSDEIQN